jgi:antitoxin ParD1/3/4
MEITLSPSMQEFVERKLREGAYESADHVVEAALAALQLHEKYTDFAPGELDELLAAGEADIEAGRVHDGEEVFRELERRSAARREGRSG